MFDQRKPNDLSLPADLAAFEQQLAVLSPVAPRIDRDRIMFAAGRAAAQPTRLGYIAEPSRLGVYFWPAATALTTAATLLLAVLLVRSHTLQLRPELTHLPAGIAPQVTSDSAESDTLTTNTGPRLAPYQIPPGYLGVRYVALAHGVGAIDDGTRSPSVDATQATPPASAKDLLRELMPKSENPSS